MLYTLFLCSLVAIGIIILSHKFKRIKARILRIGTKSKSDFTLCSSPNCVRCNRNQISISKAKQLFVQQYSTNDDLFVIGLALEKENDGKHIILVDGLGKDYYYRLDRDIYLLENNWKQIRNEFKQIRRSSAGWQFNCASDGSESWRVFSLMNQGKWIECNMSLCPSTSHILLQLTQLMDGCAFGYVFFSVLPPNTHIEQHCGPTNARTRCHLCLQLPSEPEELSLTVSNVKKSWNKGGCLLFDDSQPHSVQYKTSSNYSNSAKERVVLLVDFWHPQLSLAERDCLNNLFPSC